MKIHSFNLQNWKAIKNLEAQLNGANVFIMGKNGKGKTSVIQALYCLATGKEFPSEPIANGKQTANISMEIGGEQPEWILDLEFSDKTPKGKLTVTSTVPGSRPIKAARTFLDELIGGLLFDPFEFLSLSAKKQVEMFKNLLDVNCDVLQNEYDETFELRAGINKDIVNLKGAMSKMDVQPHELKIFVEPKDTKAISEKLTTADKHNKERNEIQQQLLTAEKELERYKNGVSGLEVFAGQLNKSIEVIKSSKLILDQIGASISQINHDTEGKVLENHFNNFRTQATVLEAKLADVLQRIKVGSQTIVDTKLEIDNHTTWLNNPVNIEQSFAEINKQYQDAVNFNAKCKTVAEYVSSMMEIDEKQEISTEYTSRLKEILKEMAQMVSKSKNNPVPLLTVDFENGRLLYSGLPLEEEQISKSKIISIGIELMMAHNPKLKICRIKDGSLFDQDHLAELMNWVNEQGFQAFVEIVDQGEEVKVEIKEV